MMELGLRRARRKDEVRRTITVVIVGCAGARERLEDAGLAAAVVVWWWERRERPLIAAAGAVCVLFRRELQLAGRGEGISAQIS